MKKRWKGTIIGVIILVLLVISPSISGFFHDLVIELGKPCEVECLQEPCPVIICKNTGYYLGKIIPSKNALDTLLFIVALPSLALLSILGLCEGEFCGDTNVFGVIIAFIFPIIIFGLIGYVIGYFIESKKSSKNSISS